MKGRTVQQHYALKAASRGHLYEKMPRTLIIGDPHGTFRHVHTFGYQALRECLRRHWIEATTNARLLQKNIAFHYVVTPDGLAELARPLLRAAARRQAGRPAQEVRP
jgi:hypothetical protein